MAWTREIRVVAKGQEKGLSLSRFVTDLATLTGAKPVTPVGRNWCALASALLRGTVFGTRGGRSLPSFFLRIPDLHINERRVVVLPLVDLVQVTINRHLDVFRGSNRVDDLSVPTPVDELDWKCSLRHGVNLDAPAAQLFIGSASLPHEEAPTILPGEVPGFVGAKTKIGREAWMSID